MLVAGVAAVGDNPALAEQLGFLQNAVGGILDPFSSFLTLRGIRTLALRMQRHSDSALRIAQWLESQPQVENVYYPGLPSHPQHNLAMAQMRACGPIFAFVLDGGRAQAMTFLNALKLADISNNIGDSRTLLTHPASTTHHSVGADARAEMGVEEGMIRINVGLEDPQDIIEDLDQALRVAGL